MKRQLLNATLIFSFVLLPFSFLSQADNLWAQVAEDRFRGNDDDKDWHKNHAWNHGQNHGRKDAGLVHPYSVIDWAVSFDGKYYGVSTPVHAGGNIVFKAGTSAVALDAGSGRERWARQIGEGGPAIPIQYFDKGRVLAMSQNVMAVFDSKDGDRIWAKEENGIVSAAANETFVVYNGFNRGKLRLMVRATNAGYSGYEISVNDEYRNMISGPDGLILADMGGERFYGIVSKNGGIFKSYNAGAKIKKPATIDGNTAYLVDSKGTLHSVDLTTFSANWTFPLRKEVRTQAVVGNGLVYVGTDEGDVAAIDAKTKQYAWKEHLEGHIHGSPVLVGNYLMVGTTEGELHAFEAKTGDLKWTVPLGASIEQDLSTDGQLVYVTLNGKNSSMIIAIDSFAKGKSVKRGDRIDLPFYDDIEVTVKPNPEPIKPIDQPKPQPEPKPQPIPGKIGPEELRVRLTELKKMFDDGLIPEDIYRKKVQEMMDKY